MKSAIVCLTLLVILGSGCQASIPKEENRANFDKTYKAFYDAFAQRDLGNMKEIWSAEPYVRCIHPGMGVQLGPEAVKKSFEEIFGQYSELSISPGDLEIKVGTDMAWVAGKYKYTGKTAKGEPVVTYVWAIDIFERPRPDIWKVVYHQAAWVTL